MSDKKFEEIIRDRFAGTESPPSPGLKEKILVRQKKDKKRRMYGYLSLAASISIVIISLVFVFSRQEKQPPLQASDPDPEKIDTVKIAHESPVAENNGEVKEKKMPDSQMAVAKWIDISTGADVRQLALPDGSQVALNSNSRISYREDFDSHRQVKLEGEAFFEVVKSSNPFTVASENLLVTVLGTSFNVLDRGKDNAAVYTISGRVQVNANATKVVLQANEFCRITGEDLQKGEGFDQNIIAWKTDVLTFQQQPLEEVFRTLEKYYDVSFDRGDTTDCKVTVTFNDKDLEQAIAMLRKITGLQIEPAENGYTISGNCR